MIETEVESFVQGGSSVVRGGGEGCWVHTVQC